jgi:hypothetical protein
MHLVRDLFIGLLAGFAFCGCAAYADADPWDDTDSVEQATQPTDACEGVSCDEVGYECVTRGHKAVCVPAKRKRVK